MNVVIDDISFFALASRKLRGKCGGSSLDKLEVLRHVFNSNLTIGFFCFPASFISSLKVKL